MFRPKEPVVPYQYYDTPDGQDIYKKLWAVLKPTIAAGLGLSTVDVMLYSHPKGYMKTLGRYAWITLPLIGISTTFVLTTNCVCNYRQKDDKVNWAAGGAAAGFVFGAWRGSPVLGTAAVFGFGLLALMKKHAKENGYVIYPDNFSPGAGGLRSVRQDYTLIKDNPGAWKIKELRD